MPAISFERMWVDDLLSDRKPQTTRPETDRFKVGDIAHIYIEQRGKITDKPLRTCTKDGAFYTRELMNCRPHYPQSFFDSSGDKVWAHLLDWGPFRVQYYAHFLGKVEITDVQQFMPSEYYGDEGADIVAEWAKLDGFKDFAAADEWFSKRYEYWLDTAWTVIRWGGWIERYFEPDDSHG